MLSGHWIPGPSPGHFPPSIELNRLDVCPQLLHGPQERWRSIVMSTSVCLSVREHISQITRAIFVIFCIIALWPLLDPPPAGWRKPKGKVQFWGFSSPLTMHCMGRIAV